MNRAAPYTRWCSVFPMWPLKYATLSKELRRHDFIILTPPTQPSKGVRVAMIEHNGAPVELIEFFRQSPPQQDDDNE